MESDCIIFVLTNGEREKINDPIRSTEIANALCNCYIHYYPRGTLKTYLPVQRTGNKFLVLPGDNNGYCKNF